MILRTHKIALDINNEQRTHLTKCAGVSRFAYNWALSEWNCMYEAYKANYLLQKPNQGIIRRKLNAIKREQFPWMLEVSKCVPQEAIIDLGKAFSNYFFNRANRPVYKKKGLHDSFRISSGSFFIEGKTIRLPFIGVLRMCEELRYKDARPVSVTISRTAARWYASIVCEVCVNKQVINSTHNIGNARIIGIDAGVNAYVSSDGNVHAVLRSYRNAEKKLCREQKALSRKKKGSQNWKKQKLKVAKQYTRIVNARNDSLHKTTTCIVNAADIIVIEDLYVNGMIKNRCLSKSISDASFGEFRRQIVYKSETAGKILVIADRYYPSSKTCSKCGAKTKHLTLGIREWTCETCGSLHNRDINAAINLKKYAESSLASARREFFASPEPVLYRPSASNLYEAGTKHQFAQLAN